MEAHLAPKQPVQVNKITSLCEIFSGPHDTQYCMENPKQAYVEYASSRTDEARGKWRLREHNPVIPLQKLNIGLLEETDHVFGLADGTKSYSVGIVRVVEVHIGRVKLLNDLYIIAMKKDLETPLLVGRGFLATANVVMDYRKAKIAVGEGITSPQYSDDEDEVAEIFRIDTNILDFETPTFMNGLKMCHGCMKNHGLTLEYGKKPLHLNIIVSLLIVKMDVRSGQLVAGKMTDIVMDGKLKNEALKNKAIMEGMIDEDDESHNEGWRRWDDYENTIHDHEERENEGEHENEGRCELFDNPHQETPICKIRRFEMIKYSFGEDEEYVVVKEHEYDDLTSTNEDACRAYHEIFRRMDEGWVVTRAE
ncbi:MAK10-like protein [Tanacetum coccineum]